MAKCEHHQNSVAASREAPHQLWLKGKPTEEYAEVLTEICKALVKAGLLCEGQSPSIKTWDREMWVP